MIYKQIEIDRKADYRQTLTLRTDVLRRPLGLVLSEEDTAEDREGIMVGAFDEDVLKAFALLVPRSDSGMQMRYVCVASRDQGKGIGRALVEYEETTALCEGYTEIRLLARQSAEGFYFRLGYRPFGDLFTLRGLPHLHMKKELKTTHEMI